MDTLKELIDKQHEAAKYEKEMHSTYGCASDERERARGMRRDADIALRMYLHNLLDLPGDVRDTRF